LARQLSRIGEAIISSRHALFLFYAGGGETAAAGVSLL